MAMTVRNVVDHLYRYLAKEQRTIPNTHPDLDDPLPEALVAINATLQEMAVLAPQFASKQQRSAYFRAPATVAVTGLTRGGTSATASWPAGAAGCLVQLPGDTSPNRILSIEDTVATLQFPHLSDSTSGNASVTFDSVDLPADVIAVSEPVRTRGGVPLRPANGRWNLTQPNYTERSDFGRVTRVSPVEGGEQSYFIETSVLPDADRPQLRLMLRSAPSADMVIEYQARCSLGYYTQDNVFNDTAIVVPAGYVESLFLPLALFRFFGSSILRNTDAPAFVKRQADTAMEMLKAMKPQRRKEARIYPAM